MIEGRLTICFFGRLAEQFGASLNIAVAPEGCTVAELRAADPRFGDALAAVRVRAVVADTMVDEDFRVRPGDAVAFFPPLSGG